MGVFNVGGGSIDLCLFDHLNVDVLVDAYFFLNANANVEKNRDLKN